MNASTGSLKSWMRAVTVLVVAGALLAGAMTVRSQSNQAPAQPIAASLRAFYEDAKSNTVASAEKFPESEFAFRPQSETRTYAEQLAHVADANYLFCSSARGEANPYPGAAPGVPGELERTRKTKAQVTEAVKASFAYCDRAFQQATDASLGELVDFNTRKVPRSFVLTVLIYHTGRHYGSLATYMRLKGVVPPSTEAQQQAAQQRQ